MAGNGRRSVTLKDIAERSGTSLQTVSQILNRNRPELFRPETVDRIRSAAEELGYRPNHLARSMRSGRSHCVGLVLDWNGYRSHNPPQLVSKLLNVLETRGQHLILSRIHEERPEDAARAPEILREILADGLLVNYHTDIAAMERVIAASGLPAVWINALREVDAVIPDDRRSGRELVAQLVANGHRHILYLDSSFTRVDSPQRHFSKLERHQGYADGMRAAGLEPLLVEPPQQFPVDSWLHAHPETTAIIVYGSANLEPSDVQFEGRELVIASFGEEPLQVGRQYMPSMLTDWAAISRALVDMLDRLIDGEGPQALVRVPSVLITDEAGFHDFRER